MIDRLRDYQGRILSITGRGIALLDSVEPDTRTLGQCRWELARILRAYQIHKHGRIFDPIIAAGLPAERVALARQLKANCLAMGDRFHTHLLRWSSAGVADEWEVYRAATLALIAELRAHVDRERVGIAMLEAGAAQPPPPPAHRAQPPQPMPRLRF